MSGTGERAAGKISASSGAKNSPWNVTGVPVSSERRIVRL
jgi:hypothetical protein